MRFPPKPDSSQSNHHGKERKNTYAYKSIGHQTCLLMLSFLLIFSFSRHKFSPDLKNPSFQSTFTNEKPKPLTHWTHSYRRCPLVSLWDRLPHPRNALAKPGCPPVLRTELFQTGCPPGLRKQFFPNWMPTGAEAAPAPCMICVHQALPIPPAKACQNHVWDVGAKCGRQKERKRQQDTLCHRWQF